MTIELGSLEIPLRVSGQGAVKADFTAIENAANRTAQTATSAATRVTYRIMQQQAQARATAEAHQRLRTEATRTFDRISLDVAKATADYRLGIITIKDYETALAMAKQEASALRTSSGRALNPQQLVAFNRVLDSISKSARTAGIEGRGLGAAAAVMGQQAGAARAGVNRLTSAAAQLGVMAIGTRSAVGSLVTGGLMTLGASAGVVLGVVAGAGAIAFAWDRLTRKAKETAAAVKAMREELEKVSPQDAMLRNVEIAAAGLAKAERALARAKQRSTVETPEGPVSFAPDPELIAKAQKEVDRFRKNLEAAKKAVAGFRGEAFEENIERLAKGVELRTANTAEIQRAVEWMRIALADSQDESRSLDERTAKRAEYNKLQAAFQKVADEELEASKKLTDARKRELEILVTLSALTPLSAAQVELLTRRYNEATAALERKNLANADQLRLEQEQRQAAEALQRHGAQTSFTRTTRGSTFGQPLNIGRPAAPSLDGLTFGADRDTTSSFFAGGALENFTTQVHETQARAVGIVKEANAKSADEIRASFDQLTDGIARGLTDSITDGIANGFAQGIASGSIGEGAKALTGALLNGLGDAAISFGVSSLGIAKLMATIKASLMSLNPVTAIPAAAALIALGGALKGAASAMFSGSGGGSRGTTPAAESFTVRSTVGAGGQVTNREEIDSRGNRLTPRDGGRTVDRNGNRVLDPWEIERNGRPRIDRVPVAATAVRQAATVPMRPNVTFAPTIIGTHDARAQRQLVEMFKNAAARGYKV